MQPEINGDIIKKYLKPYIDTSYQYFHGHLHLKRTFAKTVTLRQALETAAKNSKLYFRELENNAMNNWNYNIEDCETGHETLISVSQGRDKDKCNYCKLIFVIDSNKTSKQIDFLENFSKELEQRLKH